MKRSLLALALIAAAGVAGAQTVTPINSRISSETAAKAALEADGYSSIGSLRIGADGKWSGSAMRGNKQVAVSVDADGKVASQ
jgi:hypothetical protein